MSGLPHAAAAGFPNQELESWVRTEQRVGWFVTSHLKSLCPKKGLLERRAAKVLDGKVQGHCIFTTKCRGGKAVPQIPIGYGEVAKSVAGLCAPPDMEEMLRALVLPKTGTKRKWKATVFQNNKASEWQHM